MGQIPLPSPLNMQTRAQDIEYRRLLDRYVYPVDVPRRFFYPRSPYAGGTGVGRGVNGLGDAVQTYNGCVPYDYYGFLEAFRAAGQIRDCGSAPYTSDPASQYACVQFNQPTLNTIQSWAGTCISPSQVPANYVPTPGSAGDPTSPGATVINWLPGATQTQTTVTTGPNSQPVQLPGTSPVPSTSTTPGTVATGTGTPTPSGGSIPTNSQPQGTSTPGVVDGNLIPGVENKYLLMGVAGAVLLMMMGGRR